LPSLPLAMTPVLLIAQIGTAMREFCHGMSAQGRDPRDRAHRSCGEYCRPSILASV